MACDIYNLIILDRSGSMSSIAREAVDGLNETLGGIRSFARRHPESNSYVTLLEFCSCSMEYIYKEQNVETVRDLAYGDFQPCCCTPLNDAIGTACSRLRASLDGRRDVNVAVTIITDGYENASREWNGHGVKRLIEGLREKGWLFSYIGADHDVEKVAMSLSINNHITFEKSSSGTKAMFDKDCCARSQWMEMACEAPLSAEDNEGYYKD